jgi:hypothetical protein
MKNVLHFGCVIYLCFSEENGEDYFLTTEGFTKNKVRLKLSQEMKEKGSFCSGLFKIYPIF